MQKTIAILFLTHKWNNSIEARYARIRRQTEGFADCYTIAQSDCEVASSAEQNEVMSFDRFQLPQILGYEFLHQNDVVPGCTHYPLVSFFRENKYDHYWLIEYDVEFSGDWKAILSLPLTLEFDFAASHFAVLSNSSKWYWLNGFYAPVCVLNKKIIGVHRLYRKYLFRRKYLVKSFNPIFCISYHALELLDHYQKLGWRGHQEVLLPTVMKINKMRTIDLVEKGCALGSQIEPGVPGTELSTNRHRPEISRKEFVERFRKNTIYHPIKDDFMWDENGPLLG